MSRSTSTDTTDPTTDAPAADAKVEVSAAGVEVSPSVSDDFESKELFHRNGTSRTVTSLEGFYQAQFDGYGEKKPEGFDKIAKARG